MPYPVLYLYHYRTGLYPPWRGPGRGLVPFGYVGHCLFPDKKEGVNMGLILGFLAGVGFGWFLAACFHIWYYEDHLCYKPPAAIPTYIHTNRDDSQER